MRRRFTFANVTALLALFFALSAGSYAAIRLPANSVTTKQVKDHSLMARDFKGGQVPRGPVGPQGSTGPQGSQGPQGPQGPRVRQDRSIRARSRPTSGPARSLPERPTAARKCARPAKR
jgi:hypothetical protein